MNYQSFTKIQLKKLLKNSFHIIKIELRDSTVEKVPFVFLGITQVVFLFRKISNIYFHSKWLLKNQLISLFFEDMQDNVEEVLELLHKLLGELQSASLKECIVPAAKRIGADLFEIAAPEIGEILSGHKKLKTLAKDAGTKTFWKQLGFSKKKSKRRTRRAISRKSRSKNSRSRRDTFDNIK